MVLAGPQPTTFPQRCLAISTTTYAHCQSVPLNVIVTKPQLPPTSRRALEQDMECFVDCPNPHLPHANAGDVCLLLPRQPLDRIGGVGSRAQQVDHGARAVHLVEHGLHL